MQQIRAHWPSVKIVLRADSSFCREELLSWCEQNAVDYVFGLAKNARLVRAIGAELYEGQQQSQQTHQPARRFKELIYCTRKSWSRPRRVVVKAEQTGDWANPRFIVTSFTIRDVAARALYEQLYCARGSARTESRRRRPPAFSSTMI